MKKNDAQENRRLRLVTSSEKRGCGATASRPQTSGGFLFFQLEHAADEDSLFLCSDSGRLLALCEQRLGRVHLLVDHVATMPSHDIIDALAALVKPCHDLVGEGVDSLVECVHQETDLVDSSDIVGEAEVQGRRDIFPWMCHHVSAAGTSPA